MQLSEEAKKKRETLKEIQANSEISYDFGYEQGFKDGIRKEAENWRKYIREVLTPDPDPLEGE